MINREPLTKADLFYIEQKHNELDAKQIAKDLNRSVSVVRRAVQDVKNSSPAPAPITVVEETSQPLDIHVKRPRPKTLERICPVNEETGKSKGVGVMTQAQSESADASRKSNPSTRFKEAIGTVYK